jgi:hypothetical protein
LGADDVLKGGAELDGKPPVGYENDTDRITGGRIPCAARNASIITIPRPSARAFPACGGAASRRATGPWWRFLVRTFAEVISLAAS